ncbi:DUF1569 domain-containing protein [Neorhodopirellula pilleata]|uniref:DUF1569 domain-containing protein n=1 Tax=Neorhodopirellula pilleata TaxID=2714738 RepID=A0A5C6A2W0_9BACT|nr:DUF1569 domain-containing protein [Neorhodopirellula pilleata]TWT94242.1 hypothetical protein Pla100_38520 [Neorhodopirellula pilleata]
MSKITGNRSLRFDTLAEGVSEAERLANLPTTTAGQFSHAQNVDHLAKTLRIVVGDESIPKFPRWLKWLVRLRLNAILTQPAKPGIRLPASVQPRFWTEDDISMNEAMDSLREAYQRFEETKSSGFPTHPLFGKLTNLQHEQLQCRHFELHLGMIIPHPNRP